MCFANSRWVADSMGGVILPKNPFHSDSGGGISPKYHPPETVMVRALFHHFRAFWNKKTD